MLYTKLKGYVIRTPSGLEPGKVSDLVVDLDNWMITWVIVSEGLLKKHVAYPASAIISMDEFEKVVLIQDMDPEDEPEESSTQARMKDLTGMKVSTVEGEDVGKLYDLDVTTKLKKWKVWKILIRMGFQERRLRISPADVRDISDQLIIEPLSNIAGALDDIDDE